MTNQSTFCSKIIHIDDILQLKISKLNRIGFILVLTVALFIVKGLSDLLFYFLESTGLLKDIQWLSPPSVESENIYVLFVGAIIIAPIFETYVNQSLPYLLYERVAFFLNRKCLIMIISALLFGLKHFYSLFYIIYGLMGGLVFMYAYMARIKEDKRTFLLIAASHSLFNLIIFSHQIYNDY